MTQSPDVKVTLVLGSTGAGKTTHAMKLSKERKEHVFVLDEWMNRLFWMDAPKEANFEWAYERFARCLSVIAMEVRQEIGLGRGVVLDLGFSKKEDRQRWINFCREMDVTCEILFLEVPREERLRRVQERNKQLGVTEELDAATFDWMDRYFELPTAEELPLVRMLRE